MTPAEMGWVMAPATMVPMAPMTRLRTPGRSDWVREAECAEATAERTLKGSRNSR